MLVFITGATGFIGGHIARRVVERGDNIKCLVRPSSNVKALEGMGASLVRADITDKEALKRALEGVDIVYHSAAIVGEWISKKDARRINVQGTLNLLEASLDAGVKRFIHVSSLAVLGMRHHHNTPADAPYRMTGDIYSDTKIESERIVMDFYRKHGLPIVVIRPGFVFGANDRRFLPRVLKLIKEKKFIFLGDGSNIMNLVYIDNLVDALIQASLKKEAVGHAYNVTNRDKVTMRDFIFMMCDILRLERPRKSMPLPLAKFLAATLETISRLIKKKEAPLLTKARVKVSGLNLDYDISKTVNELGYDSKISIREGLEKTLIGDYEPDHV